MRALLVIATLAVLPARRADSQAAPRPGPAEWSYPRSATRRDPVIPRRRCTPATGSPS
jgi:hypothetical protein